MAGELNMRWDAFETALARRAATSSRDFLSLAVEQARGMLREVIGVTPPGRNGDGMTEEAMARGKNKVINDLIGGRRKRSGIFASFDRTVLDEAVLVHGGGIQRLWTTRTGEPFGVETDLFRPNASLSDMRAHHKRYWKRGKMTEAGARTRDIGRWKFIDRMVVTHETLDAYIHEVQSKVGYLASGWRVAAQKLGVTLPKWIRDADGPSTCTIAVSDTRIFIRATNEVYYAGLTGLKRRIQFAIDAQTGKMQRQWEDYTKKWNQAAGL